MKKVWFGAGLALALLVAAPPTSADAITPQAALERLFTSDTIRQEWFAPAFLAQVSVDQVKGIVAQLEGSLGNYKRIDLPATDNLTVVFDKGSVPATIHLDDQGRIDGLFFRPPTLNAPAPGASPQGTGAALAPKAALERLFTGDKLQADWFAPSFLAQFPLSQAQAIVDQFKSSLGTYAGVSESGGAYAVEFDKGSVPATIHLDVQGRIDGLFFRQPIMKAGDVDRVMAELKALPGKVSVLVVVDRSERIAVNAGEPLAVGSTFKLAVLDALRQQIGRGRHSWGEVVHMRSEWKSLPSGILQTWPADAQLTLYSLAALMISQSDNTAADTLAHVVGRDSIEQFGGARNRPYLRTREAFILKAPTNADLLAAYRKGDVAARRAVLGTAAKRSLPPVDIFAAGPVAPDIEWFFTTRELCALMAGAADLPLMGINPGVANKSQWSRIAYKGGSEPGVLNLTTMLTGKSGASYCVSATWNDTKQLDDQKFEIAYGELLASLR
jgi:beta-lactamase class A